MNNSTLSRTAKAVFTLLILVLLAACSAQPPAAATATSAQSSIPLTGLPTPTHIHSLPASTLDQATQPASPSPATATPVAAAAACTVPASLTPAVTEGPYFKAGSPERSSLLDPNTSGVKLTLTGVVMTADCKPVANALLDFWQANSQGQYDNAGYTLRGHQFTDQNGRYQLKTVIPGLYPGRTEHIHVKVQAPNGPVLTTQLFFPGVVNNSEDGIYNPALLITVQNSSSTSMQAGFNFVIG